MMLVIFFNCSVVFIVNFEHLNAGLALSRFSVIVDQNCGFAKTRTPTWVILGIFWNFVNRNSPENLRASGFPFNDYCVNCGFWNYTNPKFNNRNTRKSCEIYSKLTVKPPERCSGVFIVKFEHISHIFLKFLLFTLSRLLLAGIVNVYTENSEELAL